MIKKLSPQDAQEPDFADLFKDAKRVSHDKYVPNASQRKMLRKNTRAQQNIVEKKINAGFVFSDGYEANFDLKGPLKYCKDGERPDDLKRIRRGEIIPELTLDLHGLNSDDAKAELAALLFAARKRHYSCVCVMHGIGAGVLKRKVPSWLVQHPHVLGFHQAPLEWGGKGAILVLVEQDSDNRKYD